MSEPLPPTAMATIVLAESCELGSLTGSPTESTCPVGPVVSAADSGSVVGWVAAAGVVSVNGVVTVGTGVSAVGLVAVAAGVVSVNGLAVGTGVSAVGVVAVAAGVVSANWLVVAGSVT